MPLNSSIQYKPVLPNMSSKLMIPKEELNWSICSSDKCKYSSLCRTGYRSNHRSFISESHNSNSFSSNRVPRHGTDHSSSKCPELNKCNFSRFGILQRSQPTSQYPYAPSWRLPREKRNKVNTTKKEVTLYCKLIQLSLIQHPVPIIWF